MYTTNQSNRKRKSPSPNLPNTKNNENSTPIIQGPNPKKRKLNKTPIDLTSSFSNHDNQQEDDSQYPGNKQSPIPQTIHTSTNAQSTQPNTQQTPTTTTTIDHPQRREQPQNVNTLANSHTIDFTHSNSKSRLVADKSQAISSSHRSRIPSRSSPFEFHKKWPSYSELKIEYENFFFFPFHLIYFYSFCEKAQRECVLYIWKGKKMKEIFFYARLRSNLKVVKRENWQYEKENKKVKAKWTNFF